jgi:hypothetical protein
MIRTLSHAKSCSKDEEGSILNFATAANLFFVFELEISNQSDSMVVDRPDKSRFGVSGTIRYEKVRLSHRQRLFRRQSWPKTFELLREIRALGSDAGGSGPQITGIPTPQFPHHPPDPIRLATFSHFYRR